MLAVHLVLAKPYPKHPLPKHPQTPLRFSEEVSVSDLSGDEETPVAGSIGENTYSIPLVDFERGIGEEMQNDVLTKSLRKRR